MQLLSQFNGVSFLFWSQYNANGNHFVLIFILPTKYGFIDYSSLNHYRYLLLSFSLFFLSKDLVFLVYHLHLWMNTEYNFLVTCRLVLKDSILQLMWLRYQILLLQACIHAVLRIFTFIERLKCVWEESRPRYQLLYQHEYYAAWFDLYNLTFVNIRLEDLVSTLVSSLFSFSFFVFIFVSVSFFVIKLTGINT